MPMRTQWCLIVLVGIIWTSTTHSVSLTTKTVDSFAQKWGTEPLSSEHEKFVRDIIAEMGINKPIQLRYMNYSALQTWGLYNAMAYLDSYVFISKYFFEKLTPQEQRFLIGHELTHIKQNYVKINLTLLPISVIISALGALKIYSMTDKNSVYTRVAAAFGIFFFLDSLHVVLRAKIMRSLEYDADKQSAIHLNAARDGISFLNHIHILIQSSSVHKITIESLNWLQKLYMTHPATQQRIEHLEKLIIT